MHALYLSITCLICIRMSLFMSTLERHSGKLRPAQVRKSSAVCTTSFRNYSPSLPKIQMRCNLSQTLDRPPDLMSASDRLRIRWGRQGAVWSRHSEVLISSQRSSAVASGLSSRVQESGYRPIFLWSQGKPRDICVKVLDLKTKSVYLHGKAH